MLRVHLNERLMEAQLLQTPPRTWKFNLSLDAPPLPTIGWPLTIVDIAHHLENAEMYGARVKQWAHTTLQHMLVPDHDS